MKQDGWDALASHFGLDPGFVDACMNDGLASDGRADTEVMADRGETTTQINLLYQPAEF